MLVPNEFVVKVVTVEPVVTETPAVLVHAPPTVISLSVIDAPSHTEVAPLIPLGTGLTVTVTTVGTPATVYEIFAVPAATPVTIPDVPTVAISVLLLCQVPPGVASVNVVVDSRQTVGAPLTPPTPEAFTVIISVAVIEPQPFVTV